mmetsp:Transcript_42635/g.47657  ORF Transcript_42635/g.47657 Transcript_42635/m.47657 type:complete len:95 (+) Transcript_42635:2468-2752(+)
MTGQKNDRDRNILMTKEDFFLPSQIENTVNSNNNNIPHTYCNNILVAHFSLNLIPPENKNLCHLLFLNVERIKNTEQHHFEMLLLSHGHVGRVT